jgi:FlgD Ig-like domain
MRVKYRMMYLAFILSLGLLGSLFAQTNLLPNGDLETMEPAFWSKLNDGMGGAQVTWAQDEAAMNPWGPVPSYWSFKVEKAAASTDMVGWQSDNNADLYWNNAAGNVLYTLRFYAKTSGVNTSPGNDDARIGVWYKFYAGGNLIAEKLVAVDQTVATKDWDIIQDALLVPSEPDEVYAVAVIGKDATGTVWFDNIDCWTDPWSLGIFNADAETPVGWMYWSASDVPNFCGVVSDTAHSGTHSALLYEKDNSDDEMVFYSAPIAAEGDKWYRLSVWVKTDSMNTDPDFVPSNVIPDRIDTRMGVCFFFHIGDILTSWDLTGGDQYFYADQRNDSTGWTLYSVVAKAPTEATGVSIRARFTSFPTGYAWFDDFRIFAADAIVSIEDPESPVSYLSTNYELVQNYPNPFNPETIIEYRVPERGKVKLNIYNMIGQKIRTLVEQELPAGNYHVMWDGKDDYGRIVATGIYLYQLRGTNALITKKMTFIK